MPYNSLNILRDFVHKLRMGDVDVSDTPEIIITDRNQKGTVLQKPSVHDGGTDENHENQKTLVLQKPAGQDGDNSTNGQDFLSPSRCNGYSGHSVSSGDRLQPSDHTVIPVSATTRHGSNGSTHFIRREGTEQEKPLDTTVNFNFTDPAKENATKKEETPSPSSSQRRISRCSRLSLRASFNHRDKKKKCMEVTKKFVASPFGVLCLILVYLSLGACVFMWMERGEETRRRTDLINKRYEVSKKLLECSKGDEDPLECLVSEVKQWELKLVREFPVLYIHLGGGENNSTAPKIWNWPNAFYGCFSVITTIGYGTIAPITKWGRLFVVVYAIVGIPLMLLLVADIGGQLARFVKIIIIAVRKRRENSRFWKQKSKDSKEPTPPPTVTVQRADDNDGRNSPRVHIRRENLELKGHVNEGLETDEDFGDSHARVAHLNGVNLHLEVYGQNDSDSSYSSCDNESIGPSPKRRKRRKHFKHESMQKSDTIMPPRVTGDDSVPVNNCNCRQDQSCTECVGRSQGHHGITIQIDCDESSDHWNNDENVPSGLNGQTDVGNSSDSVRNENEYTDVNNELPKSAFYEHQIKDCDSVSQFSNEYRDESNTGAKLDVPRSRALLPSSNDDQSSVHDDGIASSIASSIHTTASTAPTVLYKSDPERSPCQTRSALDSLPMFSINEASDSGSDSNRSPSASPKISRRPRRRLDRRPSQISMNLACLDSLELERPPELNYAYPAAKRRIRSRRAAVKFGAALGSFSSVSENDIAVFSIPLWLALLLLFIYLLIGALCYSAMEEWAIIDSFYYAFISLSTIGFGDLYFVPERFEGSLVFNFIYCFIGLSFVSMVWGLSSREFTLFARKIARKMGYYKSRRWKQSFKGWTSRMKQRSIKRWSSRRRNAVKVPDDSMHQHNGRTSDISSHSSHDEAPS